MTTCKTYHTTVNADVALHRYVEHCLRHAEAPVFREHLIKSEKTPVDEAPANADDDLEAESEILALALTLAVRLVTCPYRTLIPWVFHL